MGISIPSQEITSTDVYHKNANIWLCWKILVFLFVEKYLWCYISFIRVHSVITVLLLEKADVF